MRNQTFQMGKTNLLSILCYNILFLNDTRIVNFLYAKTFLEGLGH